MRETYLSTDNGIQGWVYTMHLLAPGRYMLTQLYVAPEHRGKGVATKLLTEVTEDADRENATLILDFQPAEFNSDAVKLQLFYERFGFTWDEEIGGMRRIPNT